MSSVNKVILLGNLGQDPEVKYLDSGSAVCSVSIATSSKWKDKSGQQKEQTEWHRVVFFGKLAEIVGEYLTKGAKIFVEGSIQTKKYTDKNGVEKSITQILASSMQMVGGKGVDHDEAKRGNKDAVKAAEKQQNLPVEDDDVPF